MVILKKIKGSTLLETLVATVLIVVVFMMASLILNNLFSNSIRHHTQAINTHLNYLEYLYLNDRLKLPYHDTFQNWNISLDAIKTNELEITATQINTSKTITRSLYVTP